MMKSVRETQETANDWVKQNTKEHYYLSELQYSLYPIENYLASLNGKGRQLYDHVRERVNNNDYKDELVEYYIQSSNGGGWYANEESEFYNTENPLTGGDKKIKGIINTPSNITVVGMSNDGTPLSTSPCIFVCDNWCYTYSGSLYKLGKLVEGEDKNLFDKRASEYVKNLQRN